MIENKCKICGEWIAKNKIAMHYWNVHRAKYKEYKENEETRDTEAQIEEKIEPPKEEVKPIKEEVKTEIPQEKIIYKSDIRNEYYQNYRDIEGEVINEWC